MDAKYIILLMLGILTVVFTFFFFKDVLKHKSEPAVGADGVHRPLWISAIIGMVTNFFDALGIGSFAPSTALFRATKTVDDAMIPGTLNVAYTLPMIVMAFWYIDSVEVEFLTLISLIGISSLGAWLGAGVVSKMSKRTIRLIVGIALSLTAIAMILQAFDIITGLGTGNAYGLSGMYLVIAIIGHFILGALATAGVGTYAPSMAIIFMLGLSPAVAFPIMMGSAAFLCPIAGMKFVEEGKYARKQSFVMALSGMVGAFLAVNLFTNIPLTALKWLVIAVVIYTSITMLKDYFKDKKTTA